MMHLLSDSVCLLMIAWVIWDLKRKAAENEMVMGWMRTRIIRQQALLIAARVHVRVMAKAVSMIEMSPSDKTQVTIIIDTFARDNLYLIAEGLDKYTPETFEQALAKDPQ